MSHHSRCPRWLKEAGKLAAAGAAGFGLAILVNGHGGTPVANHPAAIPQTSPTQGARPAPAVTNQPAPPPAAASQLADALELARANPDELRRQIAAATDPSKRQLLIRALFTFLADSLSPKDAIAEALQFKDAEQDTALKELAAVWLGVSPDAIKGGGEHASAVLQAGLALIFSPDAPPGIAEAWVEAFKNHPARLELASALAAKLSATDPQRAIALADGLTAWERRSFFDKFFVNWAARDPAAAQRWMTDPANAADAADRPFPWNTASYQHLDWVSAALAAERDPATRLDIVRAMAASMANKGTREAIAWAESLTEPAERDAAHQRIYEVTPRGIGVVLGSTDGYPLVRNVLPESASARAGLQAGDRFIEVTGPDGKAVPLYQQPLDTTVKNLQGEPGEIVTVRILRNGPAGATEHTIPITRDQIVFPPDFAKRLLQ